MVYYLPVGESKGDWWPKLPELETRPVVKVDTIKLELDKQIPDLLPIRWNKRKEREYLDNDGIYGRHFVYYRTYAPQGKILEVGRIGHKLIMVRMQMKYWFLFTEKAAYMERRCV